MATTTTTRVGYADQLSYCRSLNAVRNQYKHIGNIFFGLNGDLMRTYHIFVGDRCIWSISVPNVMFNDDTY